MVLDVPRETVTVWDSQDGKRRTGYRSNAEGGFFKLLDANGEKMGIFSPSDILMNKLKHSRDHVVIKVDLDSKNFHTFQDGTRIELARKYNNMNRRYTQPVNAHVISADNIPEGSEVLIQHNMLHDTYRIFNYQPLSGQEEASSIRYFSIPENQCFIYRENEDAEWKPCFGFATALRVFKPYEGLIQGVAPEQFKDMLYVTSGHLKGKVVYTLRSCDYEIIFQDKGRESRVIRFRHFEDPNYEDKEKREEVIGIADLFTGKVEIGEYYVGLEASDAKPVQEWQSQ